MNLTSEQKTWAVISHLSAFLSGTGLIVPSFVWTENRQKSKYTAFQALQALGYQSLGYAIWAVVALFAIVILTFATLPMLKQGESMNQFITSHIALTVALYAIYLSLPLIGAIQCARGQEFRYPLLGTRLARMIGYDPSAGNSSLLDDASEERFAAAMAHFAIAYPLTGMLPSLIFLILPGARTRYMQFHAVQTIAFQLVSTIVSIGLFALAFILMLAGLLPFIGDPAHYQPTIESILPIFIFLLCLIVILLIVPLYQIIGQWAGLRLLQGYDYRYAIVGRWAERWLGPLPSSPKYDKGEL